MKFAYLGALLARLFLAAGADNGGGLTEAECKDLVLATALADTVLFANDDPLALPFALNGTLPPVTASAASGDAGVVDQVVVEAEGSQGR